jgi:hypothetical protein
MKRREFFALCAAKALDVLREAIRRPLDSLDPTQCRSA